MRKAFIIIPLIFFGTGLFGSWYIPRKIKELVISKVKRAAKAKGIGIENIEVDVAWSKITIRNLKFHGVDWSGKVDEIIVSSYKLQHILPLEVKLGKIVLRKVGIEGKRPRIPKSKQTTTYGGGSVKWEELEIDGLWLDIETRYGQFSVEDGNAYYKRGEGGKLKLENISLDSKKIPVYFIESANLKLGSNKKVESVTLSQLVWKLSPDFKLFTKSAKLTPKGEDVLGYDIMGKFLNNRGEVKASGQWNRKTGRVTMDLTTTGAKVGYLVPERWPLKRKDRLRLDGKLTITRTRDVIDAFYKGEVDGLSVSHRLLAKREVSNLKFGLNFHLLYNHSKKSVEVTDANFSHKKIKGNLWLKAVMKKGKTKLKMQFAIPEMKCDDVVRSLPPALFPNVSRFKLSGKFETKITAKVDFAHLDRKGVKLGGRFNLDKCYVKYAPPYFRTSRIKRDFDFTIIEPGGQNVVVSVDSDGDFYTPYGKISPYMVQAVLTTEDGRFWRHKGFITSEFSAALAKNLKAGKFKWGASSITMQIVKNVYLKRRKTLSRKFEELFLTWHVERYIKKRRLMEIYLNMIELGPDIYGVTRASRHFFGKEPEELTPKESIYFASLLPSPKKRYRYYCKGEISKYWNRYLNRLLYIMKRRKRISTEEYNAAILQEIKFDHTNFEGRHACRRLIRRYRGR
jgi:Transglycosylase